MNSDLTFLSFIFPSLLASLKRSIKKLLLQYAFGFYFKECRATITIEDGLTLRVRSLETASMYRVAINELIPQRLISSYQFVVNRESLDFDQRMLPKYLT